MSIADDFEAKLADLKDEVERAVEIAVLTEQAKFILSRLATLNPQRAADYTTMVNNL